MWSLLHGGDWVLPLRNGIIASKPPLFHWVAAILSSFVGEVSPGTVRLLSLLSASGILYLTLFVVSAICNEFRRADKNARILGAAIILSSSYLFHANAMDAKVDMFFSFWVTAGVAGFLYYRMLHEVSRGYWLLWICCGLAALTKGPLGIVLGGIVATTSVVWVYGWSAWIKEIPRHIAPFLCGCLIPAFWYYAAFTRGGDALVEKQIIFENIQRVLGSEHMNSEVFWFYIPSFLRTLFPWSLFFVVGLWTTLRQQKQLSRQERIERVGLVIGLVGILFFSIPSGKRHSYLLPLVPWIAMSLSFHLKVEKLLSFFQRYSSRFVLAITALLSVVAVGLGLSPELVESPRAIETLQWASGHGTVFLWLLVLMSIFCVVDFFIGRNTQTLIGTICLLALIVLLESIGLSVKGALKRFPESASEINEIVGSAKLTVIKGSKDEYFDPLLFYLKRPVLISETVSSCDGQFIMRAETLRALPDRSRFQERGQVGEFIVFGCSV